MEMKKPKLYLYLAVASVALAVLSWYMDTIGLLVAIPILVLSHIELRNSIVNYSFKEIKYLKAAKILSLISLFITVLIYLFTVIVGSLSIISYFSH